MAPGFAMDEPMLTASVALLLLPQALFARAEIVPPVKPVVTDIELEDDDPIHPVGNTHV